MEPVEQIILPGGLTVLVQPVGGVESASFAFLLPGGSAALPDGCCGAAAVLNDWLFRGAGPYNSRQLVEELDRIGLHRQSSVSPEYLFYGGSLQSENLFRALELYADILLHPHLKEDLFEPSRQLALQELEALDDDPRQKVSVCLYERFYPDPLGRPCVGKEEDLRQLTPPQTRALKERLFAWSGAVLSATGKIDTHALLKHIEKLFGCTPACQECPPVPRAAADGYHHIPNPGAQVHIGFMTKVPPCDSPLYYSVMAACAVLGGGMSSRLFTEVREKRGLCYAVGTRYHSLRSFAGISGYAGTTPEKAEETLSVILSEFRRLRNGISEDELLRAKTGLKSSLIMQNESTSARASRLAADWFYLKRVRPLEEIRRAVESLTTQAVQEFLDGPFIREFTFVSLGPQPLQSLQNKQES
ncbi:MAG: pitrilysin family protein [Anaerohalosphaeraceae bacterium]